MWVCVCFSSNIISKINIDRFIIIIIIMVYCLENFALSVISSIYDQSEVITVTRHTWLPSWTPNNAFAI